MQSPQHTANTPPPNHPLFTRKLYESLFICALRLHVVRISLQKAASRTRRETGAQKIPGVPTYLRGSYIFSFFAFCDEFRSSWMQPEMIRIFLATAAPWNAMQNHNFAQLTLAPFFGSCTPQESLELLSWIKNTNAMQDLLLRTKESARFHMGVCSILKPHVRKAETKYSKSPRAWCAALC